jgi:dTDP-4-dehydrorhamnose reductase
VNWHPGIKNNGDMKKKVLVLGSAGMLGHVVYNYLFETNKYAIIDTSFPTKTNDNSKLLDITHKETVNDYILTERPDVVINCIGVLIIGSQKDPSNAIYINSFFPHQLSKLLKETGGKLIHISTDCVFSGKKGNYSETDFRDADDIYGRSKALGEVINDRDLTLRTSLIGPELKKNGEGLFHWFMQQSGEIQGYSNVYWGGVTTLELVKVIDSAIQQDTAGLLHITNGIGISKFNLLKLCKEVWNRENIIIVPREDNPSNKSLLSKRMDFNYQIPTYKKMLLDQHEYMTSNQQLYKDNYCFKD